MKAEDLMIGDWVYAKVQVDDTGTEPVFETTPKRVTDLTKGINGIYVEGTSTFAGAEIYPIPITEEILEEMGFKMLADGSFFRVGEEIGRHYAYVYDIVTKSLTINGGIIPANVCYVHELQHALNMCNIPYTIVL